MAPRDRYSSCFYGSTIRRKSSILELNLRRFSRIAGLPDENLHLIYNWQTWYPEYSSLKLFVVSQLKASNSIDLNSIVFQQIGCSDCQRLGKTAHYLITGNYLTKARKGHSSCGTTRQATSTTRQATNRCFQLVVCIRARL